MDDRLTYIHKFRMRVLPVIVLYILFSMLEGQFQTVYGQYDAADLFDEFCADCHSIGEGDMKGPDLMGVERKYSEDWLVRFILSANTMIEAGDPDAVKIWEKYEKENMIDTDLSVDEIKAIIAYIKSLNKAPPEVKSSTPVSGGNSKSQDQAAIIQTIDAIGETAYENEVRLKAIEAKLDMILEYHKKSLSARITDEEIKKGEILFEGDKPFINGAPPCVTCHNTMVIDTLNWNPSAYDIAMTFSESKNGDLADLIINPESDKMKEVLQEHDLSDDESFYVTAFLKNLQHTNLKETKTIPWKLFKFIGLMLVIVLMVVDMLYLKKIKYKLIHLSFIVAAMIIMGNTIIVGARSIGLSQDYAPDQPIKFSHQIHVKENKIDCKFCHNSPEFSRESGIPTTNVCMICHAKIKTGIMTGKFEINKIRASFKNEKPIEWIKIHNLPDHVFFSHAQHVSVAKVDCKTCHGEIEEMHITKQFASLSMGWCVQCHRDTGIQFEENLYYSNYDELIEDLKTGKIKKVTADMIGANDCQKCHY